MTTQGKLWRNYFLLWLRVTFRLDQNHQFCCFDLISPLMTKYHPLIACYDQLYPSYYQLWPLITKNDHLFTCPRETFPMGSELSILLFWPDMTTNDKLWPVMVSYGQLWPVLTIYYQLWAVMTSLLPVMTSYDQLWPASYLLWPRVTFPMGSEPPILS